MAEFNGCLEELLESCLLGLNKMFDILSEMAEREGRLDKSN
jgi:hypothetical protein